MNTGILFPAHMATNHHRLPSVSRALTAGRCRPTWLAVFLAVGTLACNDRHRPPDGGTPTRRLQTVTINNSMPRRDVSGNIIDAHGGGLQYFNGRFYLYGTAYGTNDNSLALNCPFRVYSSPDLEQWTYEGELLRQPPTGIYTRPSVVFNLRTRKYVLWYNWFPKLWDGQAAVATSDSPVGPFTIINPDVHLSQTRLGDGSLFVDDDGTGYYIYTSMGDGYSVRVERLTPDYLGATGETSKVLAKGGEAPVLFRRRNLYFALCGPLCPDCPEGSLIQVFSATSPLGPFYPRSVLNHRAEDGATVMRAQQACVAKIPMAAEPLYIWMGDRWQSSPDKVKGHDAQFWSAPLQFSPDGDIRPIKNIQRWDITWAWGN
jgi:hypothetical protein